MRPSLHRIGLGQHPVVIVDDFGDCGLARQVAAELAPFPASRGNQYPGLRRIIGSSDGDAWRYIEQALEHAAPFVGGAFDCEMFDLIEASFSLVTTAPARLSPQQRAPHFDSTDRDYLAIMHYLTDTPGTAFYRQRATGIEFVDGSNVHRFVSAARVSANSASGYIHGSDQWYEQIGSVAGAQGRLVIYQGGLLHSGIISPGLALSADPVDGRLTANMFVRVRR